MLVNESGELTVRSMTSDRCDSHGGKDRLPPADLWCDMNASGYCV